MARSPLFALLRKAFKKGVSASRKETPTNADLPQSDQNSVLPAANIELGRREFLKKGLIYGGAFASMYAVPSAFSGLTQMGDYLPNRFPWSLDKICIVGAGMAGLNAAWQLKKAGFRSQVYEASNRVGGRILSVENVIGPDLITEFGAEFIDSDHHDVLELAQELDLAILDSKVDDEDQYLTSFHFDGRLLTQEEIAKQLVPYISLIKADYDAIEESLKSTTIVPLKISDLVSTFDRLPMSEYFTRLGLNGWLRKLIEVAYVTEFGLDCEEQSSLNFLYLFGPSLNENEFQLFGESDERYKIVGGNQKLCTALASQMSDSLNTDYRLEAIRSRAFGGHTLSFRVNGQKSVEVRSDHTILALPFSLLRQVDMSKLELPDLARQGIHELGYGQNSKLILGFTEKFWRKKLQSGYVFSDQGFQMAWDSTRCQPGNTGSLTLYGGGSVGRAMGQGSLDEQAVAALAKLSGVWPEANDFYNKQKARFHWPTYAYSKGSYAVFKPGQYVPYTALYNKPFKNLYFAGEHCSDQYQGYIQGAAETGRAAAEAIVSLLKQSRRV